MATSAFRNTSGFLQKCCVKEGELFDCLFVSLFEKALVILQFGEKGKKKPSLEFQLQFLFSFHSRAN